MNDKSPINLGLIGCGSFGEFCLQAFSGMEEVTILAVSDLDRDRVVELSKKFTCRGSIDPLELLEDSRLDLIHIVSPPDTHYPLAVQALRKGKHVLCEKPLALSLTQAEEMINLAEQKNLILTVNFVLRYVPVVDIIKAVIQSGIFGRPLRAYFENYAADENLPPDHWFWDKMRSGGIFVEHGVHFCDLYQYWFGDCHVKWAMAERREKTGQEDRVYCCMLHAGGTISSHYHGFDQPDRLDRQIHRILLERGDIIVHGWIPESFQLQGIIDEKGFAHLKEKFPGLACTMTEKFSAGTQVMRGRGNKTSATGKIELKYDSPEDKLTLYRNAIQLLMKDQIAFLRNREHRRIITEENGLKALRLGLQAAQFAV